MIKLVVADLDGTLLKDGERELSGPIKRRISRVLERGVKFAVASGRDLGDLAPLFRDFKDEIYLICADGAYYEKGGTSLYERKIPLSALSEAERQAPGAPMIFRGSHSSCALGNPPSSELYGDTKFIKSVGEIPADEKIFKLIKFSTPLRLSKDSPLRLHWDGRNLGHFEYVSRYASKGAALSDLQNRLMISGFDTVAIGDGPNDISLFRGAKRRISVGDRCPELKAMATTPAICGIGALNLTLDIIDGK